MKGFFFCPWQHEELCGWSIVGMNHYLQNGDRRLFVAMVKDGRCIKAEGHDDVHIWLRLIEQVRSDQENESITPQLEPPIEGKREESND